MTVEYHSSTVTKMDLDDSKTGSTLHLVDGSKLQYTGNRSKSNATKLRVASRASPALGGRVSNLFKVGFFF